MAANPYTIPARYEYKPLPLDFMLQAGLAQEKRRADTEASIYDLEQKSLIPSGWRSQDVAKAFQAQYEPKISEVSSQFNSGELTPSEAAQRITRLKLEMQKDKLYQFAQSDYGLKEYGAKQASLPAIQQDAAQDFLDPNTGQFNQVNPQDVLSGKVQANPGLYSMLEREDFSKNYDDVIGKMKPEKLWFNGKPVEVPVGFNEDGTIKTMTASSQSDIDRLQEGYFREQLTPYAQSEQYKNKNFYNWYNKKQGDLTPDQWLDMAVNENAAGFYNYDKKDISYRNTPKDSDGSSGTKDEIPGLFDNVATTNLDFGKVNPLSEVKTYNDLVKIASPKEEDMNAILQQHSATIQGEDENGAIYINPTTGQRLTEAESVALESDMHKHANKVGGAQAIMGQLQPQIDTIRGSVSQGEFDLINTYNGISKDRPVSISEGAEPSTIFLPSELDTLQAEVDKLRQSGETITKQADGNYYKIGGMGNIQLPQEEGAKLYAVQSWETRGKALDKKAKEIDTKLNALVQKNLASFDVAGKAFLLDDDSNTKGIYNPTHKQLRERINAAMGTFKDTEIKNPEFWGKAGEGTWGKIGAEFNPKMFFMKDGHWMARGNFESGTGENKKMSKDLDITIDEIIKKDLPTNGDFQLQLYSEIDDQANYILPGHEGKVTVFGKSRGKQDDVTMSVYKASDGESVRVKSNNALFTLGDVNPTTGEFKYRPHYVREQEFSSKAEMVLDVVKSQAAVQEYKQEYPYAFDSNNNYKGDVKYSDPRENKAAVEQSGKVLKEQLGWDDEIFNGFVKAVEFESGFKPDSVNTGSAANATGLIQFFPDNPKAPYEERYKTINGTKYMLSDIKDMSIHEQMSGPVADYFTENGANIQNPEDVYLAIFYPAILRNSKFVNKKRQAKLDTKLLDVIPNLNQVKNDNPAFREAQTVGDLLKIAGLND